MQTRKNPHLLELNAFLFLKRMSEKYGKRLSLLSVPEEEWEAIKEQGYDLVWLMGVWKRSPGARTKALKEPNLRRRYDELAKGWKDDDVAGSPYAIYGYELDAFLGKKEDLPKLKDIINRAGLKLILDYVPNHLAFDHPWTTKHLGCFIHGTADDHKKNPELFFKTRKHHYLAHGKDPHFLPWNDTVQINYFSPFSRKAAIETLSDITEMADGVRCDMAMLGLTHVFQNVWRDYLDEKEVPKKEFWSEIIEKIRQKSPEFIFIAEVYWDLEWKLQQLGFDYTYDKKLYDRLLGARAQEIAAHIKADQRYQEKMARFIENHDEERIMTKFGREKSYAASAVIATLPGLRFFYDGQREGRRIHLPVQFAREPKELRDPEAESFYKMLFTYSNQPAFHSGKWHLLEAIRASEENLSHLHLLCWAWQLGRQIRLIVINYSEFSSQARIPLPLEWLNDERLILTDRWSGTVYERYTNEIRREGLYVHLGRWKAHLFEAELS